MQMVLWENKVTHCKKKIIYFFYSWLDRKWNQYPTNNARHNNVRHKFFFSDTKTGICKELTCEAMVHYLWQDFDLLLLQ